MDFHEEIIHLAGNEFVLNQLTLLRMTAQVFAPVALIRPDSALRAIAEHAAITDAVEAGDGPEAERLARAHIETTIRQLKGHRAASTATAESAAVS